LERMKSIYNALTRWLEQGEPIALATIIATRGSTPQIVGASAVFSRQGLLFGTLGGGAVERDAQERAARCLAERRSLHYQFRLQGDDLGAEEAICGGSVSILVDAAPLNHLEEFELLKTSLLSRQAGILISKFSPAFSNDISISRRWLEEKALPQSLLEKDLPFVAAEIQFSLREGTPQLVRNKESGGGESLFFLEPLYPLPKLVIAGAGHVGRAVAHLGGLLGFEVTVIDDRAEFADSKRLPEADTVIVKNIGRAVADFAITSDTYVVIVTRGHSHDAEALRACIQSPAAYIGMIGSRRKVSLTKEKFISEGWATAEQFDRVHAPIGLEIGSTTIEEIAVSIAAELVLVRSSAVRPKRGSQK
jgi:xanthine dehydrogenase accessory factor